MAWLGLAGEGHYVVLRYSGNRRSVKLYLAIRGAYLGFAAIALAHDIGANAH